MVAPLKERQMNKRITKLIQATGDTVVLACWFMSFTVSSYFLILVLYILMLSM